MKKTDLPAWAARYDRKGLAFRKRGNSFRVYEVSSRRVRGTDYPVTSQRYIGTVTEEYGLIPARTKNMKRSGSLECCLSHFVIENFGSEIRKSFFNAGGFGEALLRVATVGWIFGCIPQRRMLALSACSVGFEEGMEKAVLMSEDRIRKAIAAVDRAVRTEIRNPDDLDYLRSRLLTCTVPENDPRFPGYPDDVRQMLSGYGGRFR